MHPIFEEFNNLAVFEPYKIDCKKCSGICCVALYFTKMEGFPEDKKAKEPCCNLQEDCRCKIYSQLAKKGLKGCRSYDCFGAGQFITQRYGSIIHWQTISPSEVDLIFNSYLNVMQVHQTLWYCTQSMMLRVPNKEKIQYLIQEGKALMNLPYERLASLDVQPYCHKANQELKRVSTWLQSQFPKTKLVTTRNYMGKNMKQKNLEGKDLSMYLLIAANFQEAILRGVNFLGADLRDANFCDTDLSQSLFLSQIQVNAAKGNHKTILPPFLDRPKTWDCD